jgi:hypothetical protein
VFEDLARIAAHVGAEGVYNFDMIAADDGKLYYLECNPRFFYKINLSMLAGINFVALGLENDAGSVPLRLPDGTSVRRPEAVLTSPRCRSRLTRRDWAAACYSCSDPIRICSICSAGRPDRRIRRDRSRSPSPSFASNRSDVRGY